MGYLLLTGATGFLGQYLVTELLKQGHKVYALTRDTLKCPEGCIPVEGDVSKFNLGIPLERTPECEAVFNCAGVINLSRKASKENFEVNCRGAFEVAHFALRHRLKRIVHVSTAYASDNYRNPYEHSKWLGECYIREVARGFASFHEPIPTIIFRPSILMAEYKTGAIPEGVRPGGFYEFIKRLAKVHGRIEGIRKRVEAKLHLPPWDFKFRIPGDPEATLNLMPVDMAAKAMVEIASTLQEGIFYITNPNPPKLKQVAQWVGDAIRLRIAIEPEPQLYPWERAFARVVSDFLPYLKGESFGSDLDLSVPVDREYIQRTLSYGGD